MANNILTPVSLWSEFDDNLPLEAQTVETKKLDNCSVDFINFSGRDTGEGRVRIAAAFAYGEDTKETLLLLPDSTQTIDFEVMKFFVAGGYSVLMVDYRGVWEGCDFHTVYPANIEYANAANCGKRKTRVEDTAAKTSWYEWVGVGLYARKYLIERTQSENIAVVGFRDGGEIGWKLCAARQFSCLIPVCAAGWKAYDGISKYMPEEPMSNGKYLFIAGIDSQAYAPYVKCPVLMVCTTKDKRFDYDRAHDTFARINADFLKDSAICYSVRTGEYISEGNCRNMFMFLDRNLKSRQIFLPKSPEISVGADEEENLVANVAFDAQGTMEKCELFLAEENINSATRDFIKCRPQTIATPSEQKFFVDINERTTTIFLLAAVRYSNGFIAWSKLTVKKLSGKFKNMQKHNRVTYLNSYDPEGFFVADTLPCSIGGIIFKDNDLLPALVKKKSVIGLYSPYGLSTYRTNNVAFMPSAGSMLSFDVYADVAQKITVSIRNLLTGEEFSAAFNLVEGVWQKIIAESKSFKNANGMSLPVFGGDTCLLISCPEPYAINNIIWL